MSAVQPIQVAECGITRTINGREWVCIAEPHDTPYQRSRKRDSRGYWPKSERHYFQVRYPNRGQRDV